MLTAGPVWERLGATAAQLSGTGFPGWTVAAAIAFLASDDASFVTGAALTVDGGWSVCKMSS